MGRPAPRRWRRRRRPRLPGPRRLAPAADRLADRDRPRDVGARLGSRAPRRASAPPQRTEGRRCLERPGLAARDLGAAGLEPARPLVRLPALVLRRARPAPPLGNTSL